MSRKPLIYIVAAESSGEQLGAALIENMAAINKDAAFKGIGGAAMAEQGIVSPFDISPLSLLGLFEGLKSYPTIMDLVRRAADDIIAVQPDAVVLIDSWGFMVRVAERLKKLGFKPPIIKYVAPQVWAMREGRTKVLAKCVDHLLTIHSFDGPYFEREGLPTTYIGNPVFDTDYKVGDGAALRAQYNIDDSSPVLVALFGSRLSEIQNLKIPFAHTVKILQDAVPGLRVISPVASHIYADVLAAAHEDTRLQDVIFLSEDRKLDAFAAADASLACSGTVTTQLACAGVPTVLAYKLGAMTWAVVSRLYKPDYVGIVNIAAQRELMPEFLQSQVTGPNMAQALLPFLSDKTLRDATSQALIKQTDDMRRGRGDSGKNGGRQKSSARAAAAILDVIS